MTTRKKAQAYPFAPNPMHPGVSPQAEGSGGATHSIWQDPSSYNPLTQGPPYLPGMQVTMHTASKTAGLKLAIAEGSELASILAMVTALAQVHQSHHWRTTGGSFFGDHLLFERLYDETQEEIDPIAEKAIGLGKLQSMHPCIQAKLVAQVISKFCGDGFNSSEGDSPDTLVQISLKAEMHFLDCVNQVLDQMKSRNGLSRGIENLLSGVLDKHDSHVYLLSQRLTGAAWKS